MGTRRHREGILFAGSAPIKVDVDSAQLTPAAANFLVDATVREHIEANRIKFNAGIEAALKSLDGSSDSAVALLADVPHDQLGEYGGMPPPS